MPESSSTNLPQLLARARTGDAGAREALFEKCRAYVGVVARSQVESWLRTKVDASDLVQQTLLDAHRALHEFQGTTEAEWCAWLKRILAHNAADFVRHYRGTAKRQARREVPLHAPHGDQSSYTRDVAAGGDSPSQMAMRNEEELVVAAALSRLTDDHREVIILRNLQRLPFDEVARRMGRTRPACQMLWMRAIKSLQEILGRGGLE
jgi:RNA polymerase sigma-70 factor (ECF subfamily)